MKLLSNFDTKLHKKQIHSAVQEYGKDAVIFIRRDIIYLLFKFYIPLVLITTLWSGGIWSILLLDGGGVYAFGRGVIWVILALSFVYFCWVSIGKLIDHYMDYMIITPEQITAYDQEGLFRRSSTTLDTAKIKSISIRQDSFLGSLFNYGSIIFYSEGDVGGDKIGQIKLNYIRSPRLCKKRIVKIIALRWGSDEWAPRPSLDELKDRFEGHKTAVAE